MKLRGKAWKFETSLGATDIVPADHDRLGMSHDWDACARHVLEKIDPGFVARIGLGDFIVAGSRLGAGHAHYYMTAIMACKTAGISAILCESVNALFQRAAIDQGYPVWPYPGITRFVSDGDIVEFDLATGAAFNETSGHSRDFAPMPRLILDILKAGDTLEWALGRVGHS